nr:40S ribosomal protein S27-like [Desmodus rotundus]
MFDHGTSHPHFALGLHITWPLAKDLLHPSPEEEKRKHKKRLVQSPNSYFMDVKCPGCYKITTVFSHAQKVVLCVGCSTVLCQGGKARLTEGCSFRRKQH